MEIDVWADVLCPWCYLGEQRLGVAIEQSYEVDRPAANTSDMHNAALRLGARGVPFTVLGNRLGIPGAASISQYAAALDQAWERIDA